MEKTLVRPDDQLNVEEALLWICFRDWSAVALAAKVDGGNKTNEPCAFKRLFGFLSGEFETGPFRHDGSKFPARENAGDAAFRLTQAVRHGRVKTYDGRTGKTIPCRDWNNWRVVENGPSQDHAPRILDDEHFGADMAHLGFDKADLIAEWQPGFTKAYFADGSVVLVKHKDDAARQGAGILQREGDEARAMQFLAQRLSAEPELSKSIASDAIASQGLRLSKEAFRNRVWPKARVMAGLPQRGRPGPKRKPNSSGPI